ncbi:MAG: hypothetical protein IJR14_07425 [Synergistaceae bacterium]|nr:hypothetical protein [Synergistaceae bacterium]
MLDAVFEAMWSSGALRLAGAFLWGAASVVLSPCGVAVVPLVVGYVANSDEPGRWAAFKISCAFCLGIVANLMLVGLVMSGLGALLGGWERLLTVVVAVTFIVMGLSLVGLIRVKGLLGARMGDGAARRGLRGAVVLGVLSGLALGPCNIAYVSPVLSLALSLAPGGWGWPMALVLAYASGYSAVLIAAGTSTQLASRWLQSERGDAALKIVNVLCGASLVAGGAYLLWELIALLWT